MYSKYTVREYIEHILKIIEEISDKRGSRDGNTEKDTMEPQRGAVRSIILKGILYLLDI